MSVLVAGIGNVFCGDDGFGVAVVHGLRQRSLPTDVSVMDVGIRARDLTYTLLDGWDLVVLVDATRRGQPPGTLTLLELDPQGRLEAATAVEAHALGPKQVLESASALGAKLGRVMLVGCEPASLDTQSGGASWNLSPAVASAVERAIALVERVVLGLEPEHA